MGRLDATQVRTRLRFDSEVARKLGADSLGLLRGFASMREYRAGNEASREDEEAGRVAVYEVEMRLRHLVGPGETAERAVVLFDLLAGGNYPYSDPAVSMVGRPLPWSPHVHPTSGAVCLGEGWRRAKGQMLFAQLLVHVMRLLNCDEPDRGADYAGWNAAAARHWRETLRRRPVAPDLVYPVLPIEVTHGAEDADCDFAAAPAAGSDRSGGFAPLDLLEDAWFQPLGGE